VSPRAEALFKKEERASEAMAEYKAAREAERAKTERLRAQRLAKKTAGKNLTCRFVPKPRAEGD
jgi:hypothetical protein